MPETFASRCILGGAAGVSGWMFVHPMDVLKVRMQLLGESGKAGLSPTTVIKDLVKTEGVKGLYSGLSAAVVTQSPFSSLSLVSCCGALTCSFFLIFLLLHCCDFVGKASVLHVSSHRHLRPTQRHARCQDGQGRQLARQGWVGHRSRGSRLLYLLPCGGETSLLLLPYFCSLNDRLSACIGEFGPDAG